MILLVVSTVQKLQGSSHILPIEGSHRMPRLLRTPFYKRGPLTSAIIKAREVRRADETMSDDFLWHFGECCEHIFRGKPQVLEQPTLTGKKQ